MAPKQKFSSSIFVALASTRLIGLAESSSADSPATKTLITSVIPTAASPETTSPPSSRQLELRQAQNSLCGYGFEYNTPVPITCPYGVPCDKSFVGGNWVGYCSEPNALPATVAFNYGDWPYGTGCPNGEICCPQSLPYWEKFEFDRGQTVVLGCGTFDNNPTFTATTSLPARYSPYLTSEPPIPPPTTAVTSTGHKTQGSKPTTAPGKGGSSSGGISTGTWAGIGVSAFFGTVATVLGIIACFSSLFRHKILAWISKCGCDCRDHHDHPPHADRMVAYPNKYYGNDYDANGRPTGFVYDAPQGRER